MKKDSITQHSYLEALNQRVLIYDGAMGTNLESQNLTADHFGNERYFGCNDYLNISFAEAVRKVHNAFLNAGADVIETNTFRSNRFTLAEFGLAEKVLEINRAGALIARQCADAFATQDRPIFVAGAMGPSGKLLSTPDSSSQSVSFDELREAFAEQARALIEGRVDLLLLETQQDILEVKAAILGIQQAFDEVGVTLPIQAQVTLDANGRMLLGTHISAVITILAGMGIDVLGINCSTGPKEMKTSLEILSHESPLPISCLPNAGIPKNIQGRAVYSLSPQDFSEQLAEYTIRFGLSAVGGCCGTQPEHIKLLANKLLGRNRTDRRVVIAPRLASAFHPLDIKQIPPPLIIGERLNSQGNRKFKQLILNGDFEAAAVIAKDQVQSGAHALDICTALSESSKEGLIMKQLVQLIAANIDAPLVIDSTEPNVMEIALKTAPGRCLLNSINLESGEEKARRILTLARKFNSAVIALTIDEKGMAESAKRKLEIAVRIRNMAVNDYGFMHSDLVFDPLTFTLASGSPETSNAGVETLEAIQLIKEKLPGVFTCLGISNISYGLMPAARAILNSAFLYHAVKAGLDLAILNPAQILPYANLSTEERALAENLIFNRGDNPLEKFIGYFQKNISSQQRIKKSPSEPLNLERRIYERILFRDSEGLEDDLASFINHSSDPHKAALSLLNNVLLPAMQEVGEQFGSGELILPFVLRSAEIMRASLTYLERYLEKRHLADKGKIILATVFGDVHDIGKNLVRTILANNGYDVIDLGKQVPSEKIIQCALQENADAIGLSALLVSTSQQMRIVVERLSEMNVDILLLIGGAAINEEFAKSIAVQKGKPYAGGVFYCRDAFDALNVLNGRDGKREPAKQPFQSTTISKKEGAVEEKPSTLRENNTVIPLPPFWGAKLITIPLTALFDHLNQSALFRISWGARNARGDKWEKLSTQFSLKLDQMIKELKENPWINASSIYGYWPCNADGNDLIIFSQDLSTSEELVRFNFPRQSTGDHRCLTDYFLPIKSGKKDIVAFQIVTLGQISVDYVHKLEVEMGITEAFYAHGLAVQLTEAAANYIHTLIRKELNLKKNQGKRYSWGYPPLPDLSQHQTLLKLLPAREQLGIQLTSAFQFIPEYTTAAMVVHHPNAAYFRME